MRKILVSRTSGELDDATALCAGKNYGELLSSFGKIDFLHPKEVSTLLFSVDAEREKAKQEKKSFDYQDFWHYRAALIELNATATEAERRWFGALLGHIGSATQECCLRIAFLPTEFYIEQSTAAALAASASYAILAPVKEVLLHNALYVLSRVQERPGSTIEIIIDEPPKILLDYMANRVNASQLFSTGELKPNRSYDFDSARMVYKDTSLATSRKMTMSIRTQGPRSFQSVWPKLVEQQAIARKQDIHFDLELAIT